MRIIRPALVAALSLPFTGSALAQPATQTIVVWSYGFSPVPLHLAAGRPVTLVFENRSGSSHDFSAQRFFASSTIIGGSAAGGEIDLPPHATRSVTLVPRAGSYGAHCSHFFHKQLGMRDQILVD
jgi:plastocyanin